MRIICTQENLIKGLNVVSRLAGKNISLPILNNILIKTEGGLIKLISTNLDIGIKTTLRGKVESEGEITVGAKIFTEYVALLTGGNVEISVDNNNILIKTKDQGTDDFPVIPWLESGNEIELGSETLKEGLSQVINSASYNNVRPEFSGILMVVNKDNLVLAATDSYRLAEKN